MRSTEKRVDSVVKNDYTLKSDLETENEGLTVRRPMD